MNKEFCTGENCDLKIICQRYVDYLHHGKLDNSMTGKAGKSCNNYKHKAFYGG